MRMQLPILAAVLFTGALSQAGAASIPQQPLIVALHAQDKKQALKLAQDLLEASPDDPQAQFWISFVAPHSIEGAKAWGLLRSRNPENPWVLLGRAYRNPLSGASLAGEALGKESNDPSLLQAATLTMMSLEQDSSDLKPLADFIQANKASFSTNADLLMSETYANQMLSGSTAAPNAKKDMLAEMDKALELDPQNEEAELFKGRQSRSLGNAGLYAFLQKTAPDFPDSYPVQAELWTSGLAQDNVQDTEPIVRAGMIAMMQRNQPTIANLRLSYQAAVSHQRRQRHLRMSFSRSTRIRASQMKYCFGAVTESYLKAHQSKISLHESPVCKHSSSGLTTPTRWWSLQRMRGWSPYLRHNRVRI
jgi:hypothetical protein